MTHNYRPRRARCPHCSKSVALTPTGRLVAHTHKHRRCPASGASLDSFPRVLP